MLIFKCKADNDLYKVMKEKGHRCERYDDISDAVANARAGSGLIILADEYPYIGNIISDQVIQGIKAKNLRAYIEYPEKVPGLETGEKQEVKWERAVITSGFFMPELKAMQIVNQNGCWYIPVKSEHIQSIDTHIVITRVAGYDRAVYGITGTSNATLFKLPNADILIAASKLSNFVTGRYGPAYAWKAIWKKIITWVSADEVDLELEWTPTVGLQAGLNDSLPNGYENDAIRRSVKWFSKNIVSSFGTAVTAIEGITSHVDFKGRQVKSKGTRADCITETGMVYAYDWALCGNPESKRTAQEIMDGIWFSDEFYQNDRNSPVYGLVNWNDNNQNYYGDDNGRVIMSTLKTMSLLKTDRWKDRVLRCIMGNLRNTGAYGFRVNSFRYPYDFNNNRGWRYYRDKKEIEYAPHYHAYMWAAFLYAYELTGHKELLVKTENALRMSMEAYPANWRWTNGFSQEIAKMVLPLAFLVKVDDTPEHRQWLNRILGDLIKLMQPCGAVRETLGTPGKGFYPPPKNNEEYGTNEASIIQVDGDPSCDLLYTTNFALLGLHEAAAVLVDPGIKKAEDRLVEFLCRIQIRTDAHPNIDGGWMRGFDYDLWEYWGILADLGWGAWCLESGWTNTWIASVLAMRKIGDTLIDASMKEQFSAAVPDMLKDMDML